METTRLAQLRSHVSLFILGGIAVTLLRLGLYLRPTPFNTPYVTSTATELAAALLLGWHGIALLSLPFLVSATLRKSPPLTRLDVPCLLQSVLILASLVIGQVDNELHRFMGIPLSLNFIATYGNVGKSPESIGQFLADEPGGGYSAFFLLAIPMAFAAAATVVCTRAIRAKSRGSDLFNKRFALFFSAAIFYILPLAVFHLSGFTPAEKERIRPPVFVAFQEIEEAFATKQVANLAETSLEKYRQWWQDGDPEGQWAFTGSEFPLRKKYIGSVADRSEQTPPNFIIVQLETFRARNMRLFNPDAVEPTTPFIDSLTTRSDSAYWTRFYCNGIPTVHTFMAMHTGLIPHSEKRVATAFTQVNLEGFPNILRQHKYHTAFFSGPDPEWDNEQFWAEQWYDSIVYEVSYREQDRPLFRKAAEYLKEKGPKIQPFLSTIVSITNHVPFVSPEQEFQSPKNSNLFKKLEHTMRYTDDVVREFYEALQNEEWFANTIWIITGDHGYDLGDRGVFIGHRNLRHESTWVPLIMHGKHPRLPRGKRTRVASHVDIAPTVLDLAGIRIENSFTGHSLLATEGRSEADARYMALTVRSGSMAVETEDLSVFFPEGESASAYSSQDPLQRTDIAPKQGQRIEEIERIARTVTEITDSCYETDRVVPRR